MKWYIYPDRAPDHVRSFRDAAGSAYLELMPPSDCYLGPLIGQLETTPDPSEAEYFLIPAVANFHRPADACDTRPLARFLESFPWFARAPGRHAVFLLGDNAVVPEPCRGSVVFMPSCSRSTGALPICYFAEDPGPAVPPIGRVEFDVSFQGTIATGGGVRRRVADALRRPGGRRVSCRVTDGYFHGLPDPRMREALRAEFLGGIARSRFVFCPRGDGLSSLRFFEVLAHGRIPILVADEAALPLEDFLPYDRFVVRVPEGRVEDWERDLDAFLAAHPDPEHASSVARNVYRLWFTADGLGRLVEKSLEHR